MEAGSFLVTPLVTVSVTVSVTEPTTGTAAVSSSRSTDVDDRAGRADLRPSVVVLRSPSESSDADSAAMAGAAMPVAAVAMATVAMVRAPADAVFFLGAACFKRLLQHLVAPERFGP